MFEPIKSNLYCSGSWSRSGSVSSTFHTTNLQRRNDEGVLSNIILDSVVVVELQHRISDEAAR